MVRARLMALEFKEYGLLSVSSSIGCIKLTISNLVERANPLKYTNVNTFCSALTYNVIDELKSDKSMEL